jgi:hypothetical protein
VSNSLTVKTAYYAIFGMKKLAKNRSSETAMDSIVIFYEFLQDLMGLRVVIRMSYARIPR